MRCEAGNTGSTLSASIQASRKTSPILRKPGILPCQSSLRRSPGTIRVRVSGHVKQAQLARAFGIPLVTVKRAVKRYRDDGPRAFYAERKTRGAAVLTEPVLAVAQRLLDDGLSVKDVAARLELKSDTLDKAVRAGRVHVVKKKTLRHG